MKWTFEREAAGSGRFQIIISKPGGRAIDVSYFRGAPVQLEQYSTGDPFGDATAVITFPQVGGFDDLAGAFASRIGGTTEDTGRVTRGLEHDVGAWLGDFSNVDIYWLEHGAGATETSPFTQQKTQRAVSRTKIWEGYIASMDFRQDDTDSRLTIQCQGAMFQLDRYYAKPEYPPRPVPHEILMQRTFDAAKRPHLRVKPLRTEWPVGWTKVVEKYEPYAAVNAYTPDAPPGSKYTGYATRNTGGWDRALTGYVQDLLSVMWTEEDCGVQAGNQWTVRMDSGRQPVLHVRDRFREPDIEVWFGQVGVRANFTRDTTQMTNIIYGEGTDEAGTGWRNMVVSNDGSKTDYDPIAYSPKVYPPTKNRWFDKTAFATETKYDYGPGFGLDMAISSAKQSLARDQVPGWSGDITLSVDPEGMSRWLIKAGMTIRVKGFAGSGESGIRFHIAEAVQQPQAGTVQLTVDTRYRDLLNLEEARVRARDPLTPSKQLRVNRRSVMINDLLFPWDYTAGSGFIKKSSMPFHRHRPARERFPWVSWLKAHPPRHYGEWYVRVNADKASRYDRWTLGTDIPILMAQSGEIRRTEIVCVDVDGNIIPVPFHFSMHYVPTDVHSMPEDGGGPSPFIPDAFEERPNTGGVFPEGNNMAPPPLMEIGWGNFEQPAGYWPGRKSDGDPATGMLVDESTWTFDTTKNPDFALGALPGTQFSSSVATMYGAFYAEWSSPVYFIGRLYRNEPGTT